MRFSKPRWNPDGKVAFRIRSVDLLIDALFFLAHLCYRRVLWAWVGAGRASCDQRGPCFDCGQKPGASGCSTRQDGGLSRFGSGSTSDLLTLTQAARTKPTQQLRAYSFALDAAEAATAALEAVCQPFNGDAPDAIFACAGASRPMFFVEMTEGDMAKGMDDGYWVQAWTAWVSYVSD